MRNLFNGLKKISGLQYCLIAAVLVIIFLAVKLRNTTPTVTYVAKSSNAIIDEAKTQAKVLAQAIDAKGFSKTVFERKNDIIGNGDISKLPVSQSVLDSLRLDNMDKTKKLQQASLVTATLEAKNLRATRKIDSLQNQYFIYSDDFATARFTPDSLGGKFDLGYRINLIRHDYLKRKNFLSPYTQYTDILSPDKRITINGLQSLSFNSQKPTRFGIGLQAGYYYDPHQSKFLPAFGLGLSYNLIRF